MNNFISEKNIPLLTDEEIAELDALKDRKIDYSDIPPLTDEEVERFRANIRRKKNLRNCLHSFSAKEIVQSAKESF